MLVTYYVPATMEEKVKSAREHFRENYAHIGIGDIEDSVIAELLSRSYIVALDWSKQMDCLYDYIISQSLCDVVE
jgi:hypothetical protein